LQGAVFVGIRWAPAPNPARNAISLEPIAAKGMPCETHL
jgi:hypothetical protein